MTASLVEFLRQSNPTVRDEAANAIAQSFRGAVGSAGASAIDGAFAALTSTPRSDAVYRSVGRLPYDTAPTFKEAEAWLRSGLARPTPAAGAARGVESLARLGRRFLPLDPETLERLRALASRAEGTDPVDVRRNAMAALIAAQGADAETVERTLSDPDPEIRRLVVLVLGGAGSPVAADQRRDLLGVALTDRSAMVRYEAVRAWARRPAAEQGCQPLLNLLDDPSPHIVLAAIDALGERCRDDDDITIRLASESRTPPVAGSWQREAHALVSLAKRSPERAAIALPTFAMHDRPQVRMYAVRAAAAMESVDWLARLAADRDDNVVEAALPALRKRAGAESDPVFVAALKRSPRSGLAGPAARPYQVLRAAANELKGAAPGTALADALAAALRRTSADRCDTSRDARIALIERLGELGSPAYQSSLAPLLRDQDPRVAGAAAALLERWTGKPQKIATPLRSADVPSAREMSEPVKAIVDMDTGGSFEIEFLTDQAPLARARFLRLARAHYYDGLTFHRIVPNFVIQGGSPNANEYCGDCPFMRDEVGLPMNLRGTIGVSTRGRDTGDAQIFINLVDNARLDHDYTIFARVCGSGMDVVDNVLEGDRMQRVLIVPGRCLP